MKIEDFRRLTVHRNLSRLTSNPDESILSCGFINEHADKNTENRNITFSCYGGLYLLSGSGTYIDRTTGEETPIRTGCFVQRLPGVCHNTIVNDDGEWLEFFICFGRSIYETMSKLGLFDPSPVMYVGHCEEVRYLLTDFYRKLEAASEDELVYMLFEVEKLLYRIQNFKDESEKDSVRRICACLKDSVQVGCNIQQLLIPTGIGYESARKIFKKQMGISLNQYIITNRINRSKSMLMSGLSCKQTAIMLGYYDEYAFINQFKKQTGLTPARFRLLHL